MLLEAAWLDLGDGPTTRRSHIKACVSDGMIATYVRVFPSRTTSPPPRARPPAPAPRPHAKGHCGGLRVRGGLLRLREVPDPVGAPVTETTATMKGEEKALHTENTAWTSKHARLVLQSRHKPFIEHSPKPIWLDEEIELRNKSLTAEAKKARKAKNRKRAGAEDAGEPPSSSNDELFDTAKPKPKAQKKSKWDPLNRKVHEDPRGHVGKIGTDFGNCEDNDRKVGVIACFMNSSGMRKNKHLWCVCDRARNGHWVSTQGNHSDHSLAHPNAPKEGYAISSKSEKYVKETAKPPNASGRRAAATSSSKLEGLHDRRGGPAHRQGQHRGTPQADHRTRRSACRTASATS